MQFGAERLRRRSRCLWSDFALCPPSVPPPRFEQPRLCSFVRSFVHRPGRDSTTLSTCVCAGVSDRRPLLRDCAAAQAALSNRADAACGYARATHTPITFGPLCVAFVPCPTVTNTLVPLSYFPHLGSAGVACFPYSPFLFCVSCFAFLVSCRLSQANKSMQHFPLPRSPCFIRVRLFVSLV